jgi:hypothetical protein
MTFNFSMQAIDHVINSAAKTYYMSSGKVKRLSQIISIELLLLLLFRSKYQSFFVDQMEQLQVDLTDYYN